MLYISQALCEWIRAIVLHWVALNRTLAPLRVKLESQQVSVSENIPFQRVRLVLVAGIFPLHSCDWSVFPE